MAKIKVRPEDFIVEELIDIPFAVRGSYTILKLEKQYWNTLDVIDYVARKKKVPVDRFERAGLKDRYSRSTQYLSFKGDFKDSVVEKNFTVRPVGKSNMPVSPAMLRGNRFCMTLRKLHLEEIERIHQNAREISNHGFANYFGEQRFGSARHGEGFIAKKMILEHYGGALKLLLCHAHRDDNAAERRFKTYCYSHWRDWEGALNIAPRFYRSVLYYLCTHPKDFKNALKQIDREYLNLYLLAYQSYIFNETLARLIIKYGAGNVSVKYSMGRFVFYRRLQPRNHLRSLSIPMVNEKTNLSGMVGMCIKKVLAKEGITLKRMGLQKMRLRGVRFKTFSRSAVIFPEDFDVSDPQPDELYPRAYRCSVKCKLPPGTYATILIERCLL
ncbi:MAG: tRNA pseudouridine(13) synthase TruD [candidate division WOR-3 bacterium]|nr:MAG: tRNA pseudouridine(13) synthase TruD [candidate division WOR-3 bacterium]